MIIKNHIDNINGYTLIIYIQINSLAQLVGFTVENHWKDLDDEQQQMPASSLRNEEFIPDEALHMELLHDLIPLVSRVIVDNIKAFESFKPQGHQFKYS